MCGASAGETQVGDDQTAFMTQLMAENTSVYGESQGILNNLNSVFTPILQAGVNQKGFSDAESDDLNTQATESTATNFAHAKQELQEDNAAQGGGNLFEPGGVEASEKAGLDATAASSLSSLQSNILQSNYAQGRQNFYNAAGTLGDTAKTLDPTGMANAATASGSAASQTQHNISQDSNSIWTSVFGALGGIAGQVAGGWAKNGFSFGGGGGGGDGGGDGGG